MTTLPPPPSATDILEDLRTLVRMDTTNPPGGEEAAITWIAQRLQGFGIASTVVSSDGRPNLVARVAGRGEAGPVLMAGHVDVVPVSRAHWTQDPFGAAIHEGYLYGRGTIDMKYMVVMSMHALIRAHLAERAPRGDLVFAAVSDEEAGCTHGSKFLVDQHAELVRAEYMLGEFGGFSLDIAGVRYYPVQVAEKGVCQFRLTKHGEPGHGSIPHAENAVVRLSEALAALGRRRLPQHKNAVVETFIRTLAKHQSAPNRHILPLLLRPHVSGIVIDRVLPERSVANTMAANLANTVSPTMLDAGAMRNVIPTQASAVIDGRTLPGHTADDLFREVTDIIGAGFDFEPIVVSPGRQNEGWATDPLYRAIEQTLGHADPSGVPVPYMLTGFTDAKEFGRLGMTCYGFAPVRFPATDEIKFAKLVHGHDERIHVDGFAWGVETFWHLIRSYLDTGDVAPA